MLNNKVFFYTLTVRLIVGTYNIIKILHSYTYIFFVRFNHSFLRIYKRETVLNCVVINYYNNILGEIINVRRLNIIYDISYYHRS